LFHSIVLLGTLCSPTALAADEPSYTIRWAQIHLPSSAADRAAFEFARQVEEETDGDVDVIVYARTEYEEVVGKRRNAMQIVKDVSQGELDMTQAYTHVLARYSPPLKVLGMPYLFRDYAHAEQVFTGPEGRPYFEDLEKNSALKGFGITYSGGMGVISTQDTDARDPSALDEMRIMISRGRYARMAFLLGGSYVVVGPDGLVPLAREGLVDAAETTVSCFDVYRDYQVNNVVNETHHFLLTSMIIMNKGAFAKLPPAYQEIVTRIAEETVVREREWSIESTVASRQKLTEMGITFYDLTAEDKLAWKAKLEPLYDQVLSPSERRLAARIRAVGDPNAPPVPTAEPASPAAAPVEVAESAAGCTTTPAPARVSLALWLLGLVGLRRARSRHV
jgi:TRAP-type C4-dicarboxylate transport system substrate-binding protein